jgi:hypothetical protein
MKTRIRQSDLSKSDWNDLLTQGAMQRGDTALSFPPLPPRLYHGTSLTAARCAVVQGLMPRSYTKRNNWKHTVGSNPNAVYLTACYPFHFALNAAQDGEAGAIIEIDMAKVSRAALVVDEDAIEQAFRGRDGLPEDWDMKRRTMHYRSRVLKYKTEASLAMLGTCGVVGGIAPEAITRVLVLSAKEMASLVWSTFDGTISTTHFAILGEQYKQNVQWLFGGERSTIMSGQQSLVSRVGTVYSTPFDGLKEAA